MAHPVVHTEAELHNVWCEVVSEISDFAGMALFTGAMVEDFALIFSAGYQAALRHTFPRHYFADWAAFAVSEDKSGALPGVDWEETGDGFVVTGSKTWIAASECVQELVIKAGRGGRAKYFAVPRDTAGLTIETRPPGRVLPGLSQGSAHFDKAVLPAAADLDTTLVPGFAAAEVYYIYLAFLGSTWRRWPDRATEVTLALEAAAHVEDVRELNKQAHLAELNAQVQSLLRSLRDNEGGADDLWRRDYKLIAMYDF